MAVHRIISILRVPILVMGWWRGFWLVLWACGVRGCWGLIVICMCRFGRGRWGRWRGRRRSRLYLRAWVEDESGVKEHDANCMGWWCGCLFNVVFLVSCYYFITNWLRAYVVLIMNEWSILFDQCLKFQPMCLSFWVRIIPYQPLFGQFETEINKNNTYYWFRI